MKKWVVGIDEVGRGPLAGPVYVCVVAMPVAIYKRMKWKSGKTTITDSKLMMSRAREHWYRQAQMLSKEGKVRIGIGFRQARAIDTKGISACIRECIAAALKKIDISPDVCEIVLDGGLRAPKEYKNQQTVIKGDRIHKIISLASVVAKVTRDRVMTRHHAVYPAYRWAENKGYGTRVHIEKVCEIGLSPMHRKTFCRKLIS